MDLNRLEQHGEFAWHLPRRGAMRVPGVIYADAALLADMDDQVAQQIRDVASLPGIALAAYALPDAHSGYGFPIGGVAAFDPDQGGVVSAGGVGFDVSCGVRMLHTGLGSAELEAVKAPLVEALFQTIPSGLGGGGSVHLDTAELDAMLAGGARWAVERGYGWPQDLARIEERGCMAGADPRAVSDQAKHRQRNETGTLGSGNHYLEVQAVETVFDTAAAAAFGLRQGEIVVSIHCGSRGLGHQVGTDFLARMAAAAPQHGIVLPNRELACAPLESALGREYLGAMRAAINCALANRQILTHLTRQVFSRFFPEARLTLVYDVSHNTCKEETHRIDGQPRRLFVHRKGATRALGPGHPELPAPFAAAGQPVIVGGSMGTASYVLAGSAGPDEHAFGSACHGAGRRMSRHEATRRWQGRAVVDELAGRGILIRSPSLRGVAEEAPGAYKDV
ncbi:MAG TPA: RtcB family protein, partial [Candidatus Macondimonas sp.]|nr:RtcB family protein [Candidatus Macondimonas sp.]